MSKMRNTVALTALFVAAGVAAAQAGTVFPTDQASYARWRVDAAFQTVAAMPAVAPVSVPLAMKGDLPVPAGCAGGADEAECMDVAYEPSALPSIVVESRFGTTSNLLRMDAMAVAGVPVQSDERTE